MSPVSIYPSSIDEQRKLKCITVGAGISGILAGIRLPQYIPNIDLTIYDKNSDVTGTWYENRYPGVACDIPAHSYQLSFEPNPNWSHFYASGKELHDYWQGVANKYGVTKYTKLSHKVTGAEWNEDANKWFVTVENLLTKESFIDDCDILYVCVGTLNDWRWPDVKGLHDFKGELLHSAAWDESWDAKGKNVAVIGAGSSAIQIVPTLQKVVNRLDNYVRGKTWISPPFAAAEVEKHTSSEANFEFSEDELKRFREDPEFFLKYRKAIEDEIQGAHHTTFIGPDSDAAAALFLKNMEVKLANRPDIFKALIPSFPPGCRRLTPGPGYLNSLVQPNVNFITTGIDHITETGLVTVDGVHREVDALICATGFDTTYTGRFPIKGRNGKLLNDHWTPYPSSYLSITTDGFPNLFTSFGPNSALGSGSLSMMLEKVCEYVTKTVSKMAYENILTVEPKKEAVDNFVEYCRQYFKKTVFSKPCRSWYKGGKMEGDIISLWPGSSLHAIWAFSHPRWEDFNYTYVEGNPMAWFGDGWTETERRVDGDRSYYLNPDQLDTPPVAASTSKRA
ncbi:hypothetical protein BZA70DRAFT_274294 [Myxozyma melibiosi]|uniref:Uncharacterized protein n=1 Tax=Myxozyma melibiosi TaxID=54550 RepID=A0ABR1F9E3_9ASCO